MPEINSYSRWYGLITDHTGGFCVFHFQTGHMHKTKGKICGSCMSFPAEFRFSRKTYDIKKCVFPCCRAREKSVPGPKTGRDLRNMQGFSFVFCVIVLLFSNIHGIICSGPFAQSLHAVPQDTRRKNTAGFGRQDEA